MSNRAESTRSVAAAFEPIPSSRELSQNDFRNLFERPEDTANAIVLDPQSIGLPWSTAFPYTKQSKHWRSAEQDLRDFIVNVSRDADSNKVTLPEEMDDSRRQKKVEEFVESGISCCTYLYPHSSSTRLSLLSQAVFLLFMHDGKMSNSR